MIYLDLTPTHNFGLHPREAYKLGIGDFRAKTLVAEMAPLAVHFSLHTALRRRGTHAILGQMPCPPAQSHASPSARPPGDLASHGFGGLMA